MKKRGVAQSLLVALELDNFLEEVTHSFYCPCPSPLTAFCQETLDGSFYTIKPSSHPPLLPLTSNQSVN